MDLNRLYSDHQISVLRAAATPDQLIRSGHLANAELVATQIHLLQIASGAAASDQWRRDAPSRASADRSQSAPA